MRGDSETRELRGCTDFIDCAWWSDNETKSKQGVVSLSFKNRRKTNRKVRACRVSRVVCLVSCHYLLRVLQAPMQAHFKRSKTDNVPVSSVRVAYFRPVKN